MIFDIVFFCNTRGFLQSITDAKGGNPALTQNYTRDKRGLVLTLSETHQGESATVWTYGYDSLKRLATAVATGQNPASYSYTYDKAGNRLTKSVDGSLTRYGYNPLDQLVWEHSATGGEKSYEFDTYGNLTVEKLGTITKRTYTWDAENRMTKVVLSENGKTYAFRYDADGTRVKREVSGSGGQSVKTNYLSDYVNPSGYSQALQETDEAGQGRAYVWSGEGLLAQSGVSPESSEETRFPHADHLGTVKTLTDSAGAVAGAAFKYSPFGELTAGSSEATSYKFTGQYAEDELGLQNHRARWYSAASGQWSSKDPLMDFPDNFANAHSYSGLNPINNLDPSGLFSMGEVSVASAIQSITVNMAFSFASDIVLKTIFTAIGIDPSQILAPATNYVAGALGIDQYLVEAHRLYSSLNPNNLQSMMAAVSSLSRILTIFMVAWEAASTLYSIVRFAMSRTASNAMQLFQQIHTMLMTTIDAGAAFDLKVNPYQMHHIFPKNYGSTSWRQNFYPIFETWFEKAGVSIDDDINKRLHMQTGGHSKAYYKFVFKTGRRHLSGVIEGGEKSQIGIIGIWKKSSVFDSCRKVFRLRVCAIRESVSVQTVRHLYFIIR